MDIHMDIHIDIHIWISIWISIYGYPYGYPFGYPYMDIHIWISIYGYPYMDITTYMLSGHETSFILRYQYVNKMNRIRILFSIDLDDQNKVPYGPKHGLYKN